MVLFLSLQGFFYMGRLFWGWFYGTLERPYFGHDNITQNAGQRFDLPWIASR